MSLDGERFPPAFLELIRISEANSTEIKVLKEQGATLKEVPAILAVHAEQLKMLGTLKRLGWAILLAFLGVIVTQAYETWDRVKHPPAPPPITLPTFRPPNSHEPH